VVLKLVDAIIISEKEIMKTIYLLPLLFVIGCADSNEMLLAQAKVVQLQKQVEDLQKQAKNAEASADTCQDILINLGKAYTIARSGVSSTIDNIKPTYNQIEPAIEQSIKDAYDIIAPELVSKLHQSYDLSKKKLEDYRSHH
jgi:hypothetical protein